MMIAICQLILDGLWSFGAAAFFAAVFNAGKYEIILGGIVGSAGWVLYRYCTLFAGQETYGYLAGAFLVAFLAEMFAYVSKNPATVYLIPGLLPLVPGGGMFQTMRELVTGNTNDAFRTGYKTLIAAGAIALGIAVASSAARLISLGVCQWKINRKRQNKS